MHNSDSNFKFKTKIWPLFRAGDGTYPCKACVGRKTKCMYKMKAPKRSSVSSKFRKPIEDLFIRLEYTCGILILLTSCRSSRGSATANQAYDGVDQQTDGEHETYAAAVREGSSRERGTYYDVHDL